MASASLIGKTVLGYIVEEQLGTGTFGTVYKAVKNNASGQYIRALKHITIPSQKQYLAVLNSMGGDLSKTDDYFAEMLQSIVSEIKILNDLTEKESANIVRYYENDIIVSESPRRYDIFILMEYLTPLESYLQEHDFLVSDVVKLSKSVLNGLRVCHDNDVIHRDVKNDNIFVSASGEFKLGDFGISKTLKNSSRAESLKGTPNFLAPEVYLGLEGYTKSVDLYSLGMVMYRLLNHDRNPFLPQFPEQFYTKDEEDAFGARMSGKIPPLPALGGKAIGQVVVKALSSSSERFQTASEFLLALEQAVENTSEEELSVRVNHAFAVPKQTMPDLKSSIGFKTDFSRSTFDIDLSESKSETLGQTIYDNIQGQLLFEKEKKPNPLMKWLPVLGGVVLGAAVCFGIGYLLLFSGEEKTASHTASESGSFSSQISSNSSGTSSSSGSSSEEVSRSEEEVESSSVPEDESEDLSPQEKEVSSSRSTLQRTPSSSRPVQQAESIPPENSVSSETQATVSEEFVEEFVFPEGPTFTGNETFDEMIEMNEAYAWSIIEAFE